MRFPNKTSPDSCDNIPVSLCQPKTSKSHFSNLEMVLDMSNGEFLLNNIISFVQGRVSGYHALYSEHDFIKI